MSKHNTNLATSKLEPSLGRLWSKKNVQIWSSGLAIGAILIYALFGGLSANTEHSSWYRSLTSCIFLNIALLVSALLCIRNGFSPQILSGRGVWLLLGVSLLSFLCGNIFFNAWELVWGLSPAGSLGDPFFITFYLLVPIAMILTIVRKKVRLAAYQWPFLVSAAALAGLVVVTTTAIIPSIQATEIIKPSAAVPTWVLAIDSVTKPLADNFNYFYVWSDVVLFTMATMIVMGFWGTKLNRAWIINSFAVICYYISDIWFAYAASHVENYQSGFILEIFWIFGAILFGLAAATEFDVMLTRELQKQNLESGMGAPSDTFYS